jgi:hypothetical protein
LDLLGGVHTLGSVLLRIISRVNWIPSNFSSTFEKKVAISGIFGGFGNCGTYNKTDASKYDWCKKQTCMNVYASNQHVLSIIYCLFVSTLNNYSQRNLATCSNWTLQEFKVYGSCLHFSHQF